MLNKVSETYRELSAAQITNDALLMLEARNCEVWRQNNHATRGRRNNVKKGVPDIIGHNKNTGVAVYCEVKKIGDVLSPDQIALLLDAHDAGCICLVAHQVGPDAILSRFMDYYEKLYYAKKKK